MAYREVKIYRDGYHYVGIPYKSDPTAKKRGGLADLEKDEKKKALGRYQRQIKNKTKTNPLSRFDFR